ncbi:HAD family hydrolase, partial [Modestobacter versicolor]
MTDVLRNCTVVVPTIGRPSLDVLLDALAASTGPRPAELVLVDDRPTGTPLAPDRPGLPPVRVVRT